MRKTAAFLLLTLAVTGGPVWSETADEKLWTCKTSLSGAVTEINYLKDEGYQKNVGSMEARFARFGKVTCPGYVTLREILRRNEIKDEANYCLLWDQKNDTYVGAQLGPRKSNAICGKTFCTRVNSAKAAALQGGKAAVTSGFEEVTQSPGQAIIGVATGDLKGTIEGAGAVAAGLASSPAAAGAVLVGAAATGGALWYCSGGPDDRAADALPEAKPYVPSEEDTPLGMHTPGADPADEVVWSSTLPDAPKAATPATPAPAPATAPETAPASDATPATAPAPDPAKP
ncbi:hypothetical protein [Paracoccus aminophilus]|nr:hypothetical protein [Paracoccus aminophilus]